MVRHDPERRNDPRRGPGGRIRARRRRQAKARAGRRRARGLAGLAVGLAPAADGARRVGLWAGPALLGIKFWGLILAAAAYAVIKGRKWKGSGTSGGVARWADDDDMARAGMLSGYGLLIGRTYRTGRRGSWGRSVNRLFLLPWSKLREACLEFASLYGPAGAGVGRLVRLPLYTHVLLVGGTGSGKGVSVIIPQLLSYYSGSVVCFDTKRDLARITAGRCAARGERVVILSPFGGGTHTWNPLDQIRPGPMLVDDARATAEALVVKTEGGDKDPHWNASAVMVLTAVISYVCLTFREKRRNLNSVRDIVSDPDMVIAVSRGLQKIGGVPGRMGSQLKFLYERVQTKDGKTGLCCPRRGVPFSALWAGMFPSADSELVGRCLAASTFDPASLLKPGTTVYLQVEPDQLVAQQGLIRLWVSSLVKYVGRNGSEDTASVLFLLDEASSLNGLAPLKSRSSVAAPPACRMVLAYQGDSQIKIAFMASRRLLYENCSVHLYLGGASSLETAQRLEAMLGEYTNVLENYQAGTSLSHPTGATHHGGGGQASSSTNRSYSRGAEKTPQGGGDPEAGQVAADRVHAGHAPAAAEKVAVLLRPDFHGRRGRRRRGAVEGVGLGLRLAAGRQSVALASAVAVLGSLDHVR